MSSVAKGFSCFVKLPVVVRVRWDPDLDHGGVWKLFGDAEAPRLEDTRRVRSVDDGSISMPSVTAEAEVIFPSALAICTSEETLSPACPANFDCYSTG